jgi:hypothetical protein
VRPIQKLLEKLLHGLGVMLSQAKAKQMQTQLKPGHQKGGFGI